MVAKLVAAALCSLATELVTAALCSHMGECTLTQDELVFKPKVVWAASAH